VPILEKAGVAKVFPPGARTEDIVSFLRERLASKSG
jgi:methylmalonyl-CoA mutase cobalamin-binding subunit